MPDPSPIASLDKVAVTVPKCSRSCSGECNGGSDENGSGMMSRCYVLSGCTTSLLVIQSTYAPRIVFPSPGTSISSVEIPLIGMITESEVGKPTPEPSSPDRKTCVPNSFQATNCGRASGLSSKNNRKKRTW